MPAFLFLRTYEDSSYKSSSMKSVRAAAIMFVSVTRHHSAKHLHKCAQLLRSPAISLKFKNLHWMLVSVRLYLDTWTRLALSVLKRLRGIQFSIKKRAVLDPFLRSAPHSKTFAQMCIMITLLDKLELQSTWMLVLERLLLVHLNVSWIWYIRLCPIFFAFDFSFNSVRNELRVSCDH